MRTKILFLFFSLLIFSSLNAQVESKKKFDGLRWRAGLGVQYASNFNNLQIEYHPSLNYTGLLGGFSGRGLEVFGGYKLHKYIAIELTAGALLNSYNRAYDYDIYILGRFNKIYLHPGVKFIYPILDRGWGTLNTFLGGGVGLNGSGRLYLEERYGPDKYVTYARYNPMVAPFLNLGVELLFNDRSNLLVGIKYQNGSFEAKQYYRSDDPSANLRNAPDEIKSIEAQGIAIMVGFIQEF